MDYLDHYGIPIHGIQYGAHHFDFEADENFFSCYEDSPIKKGLYRIKVECDKKENEFLLNFDIEGTFNAPCDRCLAEIDVPSSIVKMIWVKYSDKGLEDEEDEDCLYLEEEQHIFNVSTLIYELIILSLPMVKNYDCKNDPNPKCDFKVLAYLDSEIEKSKGYSLADKLKNLKNL